MKKRNIVLFVILCSLLVVEPVHAAVDYCDSLSSTFTFIGHIIKIAKIFIPIIIIAMGVMDLFKAVTGSKDDGLMKSVKSLALRCVAGVCIFFLPAIVSLIFSWVDSWNEDEFWGCFNCIWNVDSCSK